jgi:glycine cleavage system P protein (glycine dehydrogenase) subunit 2
MELIFEKSVSGRRGIRLPASDVPQAAPLPAACVRAEAAALPELSELDVVRHFTQLSRRNVGVDTTFYPLGSCTMKYNGKAMEEAARLFTPFHPAVALLPGGEELVQGTLELLYRMGEQLKEATGMDEITCQPLAGAHGEVTGIMLIAAYHKAKGNRKKYVVVPDSSHGTNPASAAMVGYEVITVPTAPNGDMDLEGYKAVLSPDVAAVMMTCPNTLGLFNPHIKEICDLAHAVDALVYYDGANLNAILGKLRPGDVGFDVVHVNLHKTFGTPHGSGGPGSGPVGVKRTLAPFLPVPLVTRRADGRYAIVEELPQSIGRTAGFFGNFGVVVRACAYATMLGREGLMKVADLAVLNANYVMARLKDVYELPYDQTCMHECVFSASRQLPHGVHAIDIAKFLIDKGFHPPTVYFPLVVKEAIMIEPTETEGKATLDAFIDAMREAALLAERDPGILQRAPVTTPISRPDETKAAREQRVCHFGC